MLSREVQGLQAAVYVLAACSLLSSLLALARDHLFASMFGAGPELDVYNAAFRIPDLLLVALGALVSVYVLIPELAKRDIERQKAYLDTIFFVFSLVAIVSAALIAWFAPAILAFFFKPLIAAGYASDLTLLTRIILLQPILLGFSNILAAVTQSRHRYVLYAISPLLYNIGIMVGIAFLYPILGIQGLGWGVVLGALLHAGIQVPSVRREGFFNAPPSIREPAAIFTTMLTSVPRSLTLSMGQIGYLGLLTIAAMLAPGSISIFAFAYNLQSVPLGIIGASYSVAAFPTLAKSSSEGRSAEFVEHIATAARYILFLSVPAAALLLILRAHIVRLILGSGAFDWTDTRLTAAAFALFALSLPAQGITLLLTRGYYAAGRTFVPFFVALAGMLLTLGSALFLVGAFHVEGVLRFVEAFMRVDDVPGSTMLALPLSFSIASLCAACVLCAHFETRYRGFLARIRNTLWHSLFAALFGGMAAYATLALLTPLEISSTALSVFVRGCVGGSAGLAAVLAAYAFVGNREYLDTKTSIEFRIWRKSLSSEKIIASSEDVA